MAVHINCVSNKQRKKNKICIGDKNNYANEKSGRIKMNGLYY